MNDALVSTIDFDVRGFDCGYGGFLRAFALVNFLQEAAGENATRLGFGMDELRAAGRTWMLSRLDLRVDELPRDGERVRVRTWPAGTRKLFALRDLALLGSDGRSLVRAVYAYLIVDIAARRPLRPESVFGPDAPDPGEPHPVPDYAFDIPPAVQLQTSFAQRVGSRHIDHNGHANNAHIINWLVDASAAPGPGGPGAGEGRLAALRVEFLAEALEGEVLEAGRGSPAVPVLGPEAAARLAVAELSREGRPVARALVGRS
jgi:medium-chain acyl-[acyl-carrier-protein] hydrolase